MTTFWDPGHKIYLISPPRLSSHTHTTTIFRSLPGSSALSFRTFASFLAHFTELFDHTSYVCMYVSSSIWRSLCADVSHTRHGDICWNNYIQTHAHTYTLKHKHGQAPHRDRKDSESMQIRFQICTDI